MYILVNIYICMLTTTRETKISLSLSLSPSLSIYAYMYTYLGFARTPAQASFDHVEQWLGQVQQHHELWAKPPALRAYRYRGGLKAS